MVSLPSSLISMWELALEFSSSSGSIVVVVIWSEIGYRVCFNNNLHGLWQVFILHGRVLVIINLRRLSRRYNYCTNNVKTLIYTWQHYVFLAENYFFNRNKNQLWTFVYICNMKKGSFNFSWLSWWIFFLRIT